MPTSFKCKKLLGLYIGQYNPSFHLVFIPSCHLVLFLNVTPSHDGVRFVTISDFNFEQESVKLIDPVIRRGDRKGKSDRGMEVTENIE